MFYFAQAKNHCQGRVMKSTNVTFGYFQALYVVIIDLIYRLHQVILNDFSYWKSVGSYPNQDAYLCLYNSFVCLFRNQKFLMRFEVVCNSNIFYLLFSVMVTTILSAFGFNWIWICIYWLQVLYLKISIEANFKLKFQLIV